MRESKSSNLIPKTNLEDMVPTLIQDVVKSSESFKD